MDLSTVHYMKSYTRAHTYICPVRYKRQNQQYTANRNRITFWVNIFSCFVWHSVFFLQMHWPSSFNFVSCYLFALAAAVAAAVYATYAAAQTHRLHADQCWIDANETREEKKKIENTERMKALNKLRYKFSRWK